MQTVRGIVGVIVINLSVMAGCGPGAVGEAVRPDAPTAAAALGESRCQEVGAYPRPLVVDWKSHQRGDLEVAMGKGVAVVRFDCETLELLPDCHVKGTYGFIGVSKKEDTIQLADADEIRVNLPSFGSAIVGDIAGELERGAALDLAIVMIGKRRSVIRRASPDQLEGSCAGATHFVRGAYLGAFKMATGTKGMVRAAATIFGVGADAKSESSQKVGAADGDIKACEQADPDAEAPEPACAAVLRLELGELATSAALPTAVEAEANACGVGYVVSGGKCAAAGSVETYMCQPKDVEDCRKQCERGHPGSCSTLGWMYNSGTGVAQDRKRAAELFQRGCDGRHYRACFNLAYLHTMGQGVAKDIDKAVELNRIACTGGDGDGCANLGMMYLRGMGVEKDEARALKLFRRTCNGGLAEGCNNLGGLYFNGIGVPKDTQRAVALFQQGCEAGDAGSCTGLAIAYKLGKGVAKDLGRARGLFERSCNDDLGKGCAHLGWLYADGIGVPKDVKRAKELYDQACKLGDQKACNWAKDL